jgi:glycine/D-amino acid oxidase-like deaminating enzyme
MKKEIIIVGGGVIGLSATYYLKKRNHDITIEKREPEIDTNAFRIKRF